MYLSSQIIFFVGYAGWQVGVSKFFSLSFCLDTKELKNQVSIEDVRRKFLLDRYTKRVISSAYQTTSAFRYRLRLEIFFILSLPIETKKNEH